MQTDLFLVHRFETLSESGLIGGRNDHGPINVGDMVKIRPPLPFSLYCTDGKMSQKNIFSQSVTDTGQRTEILVGDKTEVPRGRVFQVSQGQGDGEEG